MNVIYYETNTGEKPIYDFIEDQDKKMKKKIFLVIHLLEEYGTEIDRKYSKYLDDGIFELRISQSSNITRILYFFIEGDTAVLTNGFVKKTMLTPRKEIELAKKYRKDFLERNKDEILHI